MNRPVYVVSGLPRSGTSMMMRVLDAGGLRIVQDGVRVPDEDNLRGYYELEAVKQLRRDDSWVRDARGKVVKVISQLLRDLPTTQHYKVVFMRRRIDEVLRSQQKMLARRGEPNSSSDEEMRRLFMAHLAETEAWLDRADHMDVLYVSYNRVMSDPAGQVLRLRHSLGIESSTNGSAMVRVVEPSLYRNRAA